MNESAIELVNVTKKYNIFQSDLKRLASLLLKKESNVVHYAIKNMSLSLPKGESIALLGKNGAGKSTLLKMITGVVSPTEGEIHVNGTIAALLELSSGFDNELTGRENIYFKGTMLGYSKEQMEHKVQDIIDFADIGKYIDQPIRTYSSGMKSRLGFAISVNVDPEILIVDEALAVGDDVFRLKCVERMKQFKEQNKTILFVSHSLNTVRSFCTKAAWIKDGELVEYGDMAQVVKRYSDFIKEERSGLQNKNKVTKTKKDIIERTDFYFTNAELKRTRKFSMDEKVTFNLEYEVKEEMNNLYFSWSLLDAEKYELYSTINQRDSLSIDSSIGNHKLSVTIDSANLLPGKYRISGDFYDETGLVSIGFSREQYFFIQSSDELDLGVIKIPFSYKEEILDKGV